MTKHPHTFRKKWGQNFLRDPNTISKIIHSLQPCASDNLLEIGPGDGALTEHLSKYTNQVHAVEIDPILVTNLENNNYQNVNIHEGDILNWDLNQLKTEVKIIGNLPYYISSPILFKLLAWKNWERMVLMFQKELAHRIISKHGKKSYGRISVMCQVYCYVKIVLKVSKNVFQPKPEIDSAVLTFFPKDGELPNFSSFSKLVKQAFSQRRKKLKNNLSEEYELGKIKKWADKRPDEISPDEFIQIYNMIFVG